MNSKSLIKILICLLPIHSILSSAERGIARSFSETKSSKQQKAKIKKVANKSKINLKKDSIGTYSWQNKKYLKYNIHGWLVYFEEVLVNKKNVLGKRTARRLNRDLRHASRKLPSAALAHLQSVAIWVDFNTVEFPGGVYHPSATWLQENGFDPKMEKSLHIGVAQNYLTWTQHQPLMVLHELSHAYHHQVLGYDNQSIIDAYNAAVKSEKYENVKYHDGQIMNAYALTNEKEYFAETSEAFFGTNDYYPFKRKDLKKHDREMFNLLKKLWN